MLVLKFESRFHYLLMSLKYYCMYGKQCRPWSNATFCGVLSRSRLFAKAYTVPIHRVILVYIVDVSMVVVLSFPDKQGTQVKIFSYRSYPKYLDTLTLYHTYPEICTSLFDCFVRCLNCDGMAKSVDLDIKLLLWSTATLSAQAYLSST